MAKNIISGQGQNIVRWDLDNKTPGEELLVRGTVRSVQVTGEFWGMEVAIEGAIIGNDPNDWDVLHDAQGNPLLFYDRAISFIQETVRYIRPSVKGGSEKSKVRVSLLITI